MNWFTLKNSKDKDVCKVFPQTDGMKPGYNLKKKTSIHNIESFSKLDFDPDFDGFQLDSRTKPTDFISTALISRTGFIISESVKSIFENCSLPSHQYYPAKVYLHGNVIGNYYWLHFENDSSDKIDYGKSIFILRHPLRKSESEDFKVGSEKELFDVWRAAGMKGIFPEKLTLKESNHSIDLFISRYFWDTYYINEKVNNMLLNKKITGCQLIKVSFEFNT